MAEPNTETVEAALPEADDNAAFLARLCGYPPEIAATARLYRGALVVVVDHLEERDA